MKANTIYVQSLLVQYRVFRLELIVFTVIFILAMLGIPVAWAFNHLYHQLQLGRLLAVTALILGLGMAIHCSNTLQVLRRVSTALNQEMASHRSSFEYDQGEETEPTRYIVTTVAKVIGCLLLLWSTIRWPQL